MKKYIYLRTYVRVYRTNVSPLSAVRCPHELWRPVLLTKQSTAGRPPPIVSIFLLGMPSSLFLSLSLCRYAMFSLSFSLSLPLIVFGSSPWTPPEGPGELLGKPTKHVENIKIHKKSSLSTAPRRPRPRPGIEQVAVDEN